MKHTRSLFCCLSVLLLAACGGGGGSNAPSIVAVTIAPTTASVMVGQQIQLDAVTTDSAGNAITEPVTWASSDSAVATVNSTGLVIGLTLGQTTITATSAGLGATAAITTTTGITFATVSAGGEHTCGLTPDGVAYCWGDNSSGQLGNGTTTDSETPVAVSGQISFAILSAGAQHTCGVTPYSQVGGAPPMGGYMYCWGNNASGQLGNGTTTNSTTPTAVLGGLQFYALSAGTGHTCGVSGLFYCWGNNSSGQLGNGTLSNSSVPVASVLASEYAVASVSAGSNHTCGTVPYGNFGGDMTLYYCWGDNRSGQLGDGTTNSSATPVRIALGGIDGVIIAGTGYTCTPYGLFPYAVGSNVLSPSCWGDNSVGQLGNGTTMNSAIPIAIASDLNLDSVSAGALHACGSSAIGNGNPTEITSITTYCWGDNGSGQLGNGTTISSSTPVVVAGALNLWNVSAGAHHTCAVNAGNPPNIASSASGAVYCWGDNSFGQLGNSWTTTSSVPVNVAGSP